MTELSIDDKINGIVPETKPEKIEDQSKAPEAVSLDKSEDTSGQENKEAKQEAETSDANSQPEEISETIAETDEYGLEVPKARTYSEEEVQRMIRDRLQRGNHQQQPAAQQQAVQQDTKDFQPDPNSEASWEAQLDSYIDRRLETREKTAAQQQMQRQAAEVQANFEAKFTTGMEKHTDFKEVVGKMPITDGMMMSIRDMDNPATFLYAAAKLQPAELQRIAAMADPFQQAKAMGQLDERMKKAKSITRAAAPLKTVGSDVSEKYVPTRSIDDKIQSDAKAKRRA